MAQSRLQACWHQLLEFQQTAPCFEDVLAPLLANYYLETQRKVLLLDYLQAVCTDAEGARTIPYPLVLVLTYEKKWYHSSFADVKAQMESLRYAVGARSPERVYSA